MQSQLQLRLVFTFLGVALIGLLLQFLLINRALIHSATEIDGVGGELAAQVPGIAFGAFLGSAALLIPLLIWIGVWRTHRFAGPVYRFSQFLRAVRDGQQVEPCRLRSGDELTDLCELLNQATEPLRKAAQEQSESGASDPLSATTSPRELSQTGS